MKVGTARPPAYVTVPLSTVSLNLRAGIGPLRAVLNSGHRRGGKFTRYHGGQARSFATFAPVAVAAIGTLPLPVMHRSIVIHMARRDGRRRLTRLDTDDPDTKGDLNIAYRMMFSWARDAELASDPPMPAPLRDRQSDNCCPLIAIADAFGAHWAMRAREAAVWWAGQHQDEDAAVVLLGDIRDIFDARGIDRLPSKTMVDHSTVRTMPRGRSGAVSMAISSRASCRQVHWPHCWSRCKYGRGPSGSSPTPPASRR